MEAYGAYRRSITNFDGNLPTGYSFNTRRFGSALYRASPRSLLTQLYGVEPVAVAEIVLVLTLMVTSEGICGRAGRLPSWCCLTTLGGSVGIPLEGLALYRTPVSTTYPRDASAVTALDVGGGCRWRLLVARQKWEHKVRP